MNAKIIVLLLLLSMSPLFAVEGVETGTHGVTDIKVFPLPIQEQSNITLSVSVSNYSNITAIRSTYCRISPEYLCYFPSYLLLNSTSNPFVFKKSLQIKEDDVNGTVIGFHFLIQFSDGSTADFPSSSSPSFNMKIVEPVPDTLYYAFKIGDTSSKISGTFSNSNVSTANLLLPIYLLTFVFFIRKKYSSSI